MLERWFTLPKFGINKPLISSEKKITIFVWMCFDNRFTLQWSLFEFHLNYVHNFHLFLKSTNNGSSQCIVAFVFPCIKQYTNFNWVRSLEYEHCKSYDIVKYTRNVDSTYIWSSPKYIPGSSTSFISVHPKTLWRTLNYISHPAVYLMGCFSSIL